MLDPNRMKGPPSYELKQQFSSFPKAYMQRDRWEDSPQPKLLRQTSPTPIGVAAQPSYDAIVGRIFHEEGLRSHWSVGQFRSYVQEFYAKRDTKLNLVREMYGRFRDSNVAFTSRLKRLVALFPENDQKIDAFLEGLVSEYPRVKSFDRLCILHLREEELILAQLQVTLDSFEELKKMGF